MLIDICTNSDGENFFVGMDGDGDESLHCAGMAEAQSMVSGDELCSDR